MAPYKNGRRHQILWQTGLGLFYNAQAGYHGTEAQILLLHQLLACFWSLIEVFTHLPYKHNLTWHTWRWYISLQIILGTRPLLLSCLVPNTEMGQAWNPAAESLTRQYCLIYRQLANPQNRSEFTNAIPQHFAHSLHGFREMKSLEHLFLHI